MMLCGGCHCGAVRFRVLVRAFEAIDCNCSMCTKKGFLHLIVPPEDFELVSGEAGRGLGAAEKDGLSTYTFNTHTAKHHFCKTCGIHAFYEPRSHPGQIDVNVRCLDDPKDIERFTIRPFDGRNWEENVDAIR
jgi:hypothetical protein